ncbi:HD domain-containing protein [Patescibacteria group bacterium]|nr:HD domain-containing protein [Patescibacteria group bacterium]
MTRDQALKLVTSLTKNKNLVKHMLAVEAQMRALAKYFKEDEDLWGLVGLLHDADYEMFAKEPEKHPSKIFEELGNINADKKIIQAIKAHAWGWQKNAPEPVSKLDWALYCSDDLSGLIIACALVKPDKKLASVSVDSVLKKWKQKAFATGAHREPAEMSEEKLGIKLPQFIEICLKALQDISSDLDL